MARDDGVNRSRPSSAIKDPATSARSARKWLGEVCHSTLSRRFLAALVISLTLGSLTFLALFVGVYRDRLIHEHARASAQLNGLVETALKNAMLKRDLAGLSQIISELGDQPDIAGVQIANVFGEVRFASEPSMIGTTLEKDALAGGRDRDTIRTAYLSGANGREVVRTINHVRNRPACEGCHGAVADNPVNGILVVDYAADHIRRDALRSTLALALAGGLVMTCGVSALGIILFRSVLRPVRTLTDLTKRYTDGDLSPRFEGRGEDELSTLGTRFNTMASRLDGTLAAIRANESFLQSLLDAVPDGIRVIGDDYTVVKANRAYCEQLGIPPGDATGVKCHVASHAADEPCSATLVTCPLVELRGEANRRIKCPHRHVRRDGTSIDVEVTAVRATLTHEGRARDCVIEAIRDLSEKTRISQEHRLSEIGQLATGIAHEIHNPLSSIQLALGAIREDLTAPQDRSPAQPYLEIVDGEIDRCLEITGQLLRLSESSDANLTLVDVGRTARDISGLLRYDAERIGVTVHIQADAMARVIATESDIGILVMNLTQNAFHAMPQGGSLDLRVTRTGGSVSLSVRDTGAGIAAENMRRIFWPFWSKRADGYHGTGLGLAMCRGITERLGGTIEVTSEPGRGACFTITLPAAE